MSETEWITCPLCHAAEHRAWATENGFSAVKCAACGLVYVNPRPSDGEITEANILGEHRSDAGRLNVVARRDPRKVGRYRRILGRTFQDLIDAGRPVTWLDVGAGYGEVVEAVQSILPAGSQVEGIEPMVAKAAEAQRRGLPVTRTALSALTRQFDVISLINVFSHVPDFAGFLTQLRARLCPGGPLFLETGNGGDILRSEYPDALSLPDHLVFAGEKHIAQFLDAAGFSLVSTRRDRVDTVTQFAKAVVKRALGTSGTRRPSV